METRAASEQLKLLRPRARLDTGAKFFVVRSDEIWNLLLLELRASRTVNAFKRNLRAHLSATPSEA